MKAREHEIDRIASAMTWGAPGETFTARVMAPLRGLPQPGFTRRVMTNLNAAPRPVAVPRSLAYAVAAGSVIALAASLWPSLWPSGGIAVPPRPMLVSARVGEPPLAPPTQTPRTSTESVRVPARRSRAAATVLTDGPPLAAAAAPGRPMYQIAELPSPAGLAISPMTAPPPAVAPLERPSVLTIPGLRFEKEKP